MQTIMLGLASVPGVIGGMLSDERGNILSHSLPSFFDEKDLRKTASMINDNILGLHDATGGVKLFDIRSELGRIIIKKLPIMTLAVLCEQTVNAQLLQISLNVATKKLEQIPPEQFVVSAEKQKAPEAPKVPVANKNEAPAVMRGFGRW